MLTELAITVIYGNETLRNLICEELGITDQTLRRHLRTNAKNGKLTNISVIDIIKSETNLTHEQIIVTKEIAA